MKTIIKKKCKTIIKITLMFILNKFCGIDDKKIVFSSFYGKQYSDSGRAIGEELNRRNNDLKIVWLLKDNAMFDKYKIIPEYVIKKRHNLFNYCKEIATAKVYVTNEDMERIYKNKKQIFIDTWHGDRGFKKILYEAYENGKRPNPVYDNLLTDYCIAASDYGEKTYRKAFKYDGKIIKEGMPRNDLLVNKKGNVKLIKDKLGIGNEKILLYAPTFRDKNSNLQTINIDFDKILSILSKDGNEWKVIIRSHPSSKGLNIKVDEKKVIDLSDYPDMADILLISDFLITDYSSSAADFALTNKPIILYLYDYDEYRNSCREFSADPKKVGFIYADNEEELIKIIDSTSLEEYKKSCKIVNEYYKINETGKSTEIICDLIINHIVNKN